MAKKRSSKGKSSFRGKVKNDSQRQQSQGSNYGYLKLPRDVKIFSPKPGKSEKLDFLPYVVSDTNHPDSAGGIEINPGDIWYKRPYFTHRSVGQGNDTVVCLKSFGKKCPICEYKKQRAKDGASEDELKGYKASQRNLYVVIPIGNDDYDEVPHIFDFSQFLFQELLNQEIDEDEENEIFPDLEEGKTLKIRWTKEEFAGNKFAKAGRIDFYDRDAYDEDILDSVPDLDKVLIELPYEKLEAKFLEEEVVEDEDEDKEDLPFDDEEEEEEKPKRTRKTTRKSKPEPEPEPEEEPETDLTWEDLKDADATELWDIVEEYDLEIDEDDYDDAAELAKAIAEELDIEIPKEKPKRATRTSKAKKETPAKEETPKRTRGKKSEDECPSGHVFGQDVDEYDECEDCPLWDKCDEKHDELMEE